MTDKTETTTNSFQIAEPSRELSGFFKEADRSSHVPMPGRGATRRDQCLRATAWRNRTIESQGPGKPRTCFSLPCTDLPEWIERAGQADGDFRFVSHNGPTQ